MVYYSAEERLAQLEKEAEQQRLAAEAAEKKRLGDELFR